MIHTVLDWIDSDVGVGVLCIVLALLLFTAAGGFRNG